MDYADFSFRRALLARREGLVWMLIQTPHLPVDWLSLGPDVSLNPRIAKRLHVIEKNCHLQTCPTGIVLYSTTDEQEARQDQG